MIAYEHAIVDCVVPSPDSPPGMTASKSSKSSSFHSISSDDNSVLSDANHFEDIGLDDHADALAAHHDRDADFRSRAKRFSPSFPADLRAASLQTNGSHGSHGGHTGSHTGSHIGSHGSHAPAPLPGSRPRLYSASTSSARELARTRPHAVSLSLSHGHPPPANRDITPPLSVLPSHARGANVRSTSTSALMPDALTAKRSGSGGSLGGLGGLGSHSSRHGSRSATSLSFRHRSPSPGLHVLNVPHGLKDPAVVVKPRRSSWQSTRERKTAIQLEMECDEDEGDDIPDGLVLDNVPISPRPPSERAQSIHASPASSKPGSPDRGADRAADRAANRDKHRSVGNGTPAVAVAQGSLRSPRSMSELSSPVKMRAKSWTSALAELSLEAKTLTEKLEEHADEVQLKAQQRSSTGSLPAARRASAGPTLDGKPRHKSALPELPPLRRNNIMIDPLPVSKEKEAVLSRTRPSWLPPKDPAEERRHLKEYQKMMAYSLEAEKRREATRQAQSACRDTAASGLLQIWEHDILPRWTVAVRERRTRDLWWRGVAPRSRGAVWARAIGNELGLTEASFHAALGRAHEVAARATGNGGDVSAAAAAAVEGDEQHRQRFEAIRRDVQERTWRDLKIFQAGAPLHQGLMDVLMAYSMYRSDIGYVTGCNTIAALLLLNLPGPASAFVALANLLNRPLPLSFYAADAGAKASAYNLVLQTLAPKAPVLYDHLTGQPGHDPEAYLGGVFTALFTGHLALDQAARLWDVYVFEGDAVLVRAAVALLLQREAALLGAQDAAAVARAVRGGGGGLGIDGDGDGAGPDAPAAQAVVAASGEEDRWMQAVRDAGRK